jgi:P-type Cu2+ transporter
MWLGDDVIKVKVSEISPGDIVVVKPGEKVPVDGQVVEGETHIDESMLTGESKPVKKMKGEKVIGGSVNGNGSVKIKVTSSGNDSYLNKVIKLVEDAQKEKSKTQHLANKAAKILTFVALGVGFITLFTWLMLGFEFVFALRKNGYCYGYIMPSCTWTGCSPCCCHFNFDFCTEGIAHQKPDCI